MDLTSGRWPRWVARYEKGGWAVHFRSDIRKVGGGGGGRFASGPLRKVGGQFATGPLRKVGGSDVSSPIGVWGEAPEASQAGTRTCGKSLSISTEGSIYSSIIQQQDTSVKTNIHFPHLVLLPQRLSVMLILPQYITRRCSAALAVLSFPVELD